MPNMLHDLSPAAVARAVEANSAAYYAHFSLLPGAVLHTAPPIRWFATGINEELLNGVLDARLEPDTANAQIASVLAYFQQRHLPMLWHTGPSTRPTTLGDTLLAHGLAHVEDEPGMAADLHALDETAPIPAELSFTPVQNVEALRDWIAVWLHPVPSTQLRERFLMAFAGLGFAVERPLRHYVGALDGRPVATAALFLSEGVASVQHVVTHTAFRRRGIGAAMTLLTLRQAQTEGHRVAVLTASPLGHAIYRRLGFRDYCTLGTYRFTPAPCS
jgi:ribosomal protein S18 acetylase RimI-like enzyme